MDDSEEKRVAAVERALSILGAFRKGDGALTLKDLTERTGLYKSTILRLAQTLRDFGYLEATPDGAWRIGPMPLRLGVIYQSALQPGDLIVPALRDLVRDTGESATYSVRRQDLRICLHRVDSPNVIRPHLLPGDTFPVGLGASGKILIAFGPEREPALSAVRRRLIVASEDELGVGMAGIAAPVFGPGDDLHGVIAVSGPKTRFSGDAILQAEPKLFDAAARLSLGLGGNVALFEQASRPSAEGDKREP